MYMDKRPGQPVVKEDEDVHFEREIISTTASSPEEGKEPEKSPAVQGTILPEVELMGADDFPPLSEEEKQPKLHDEEDM